MSGRNITLALITIIFLVILYFNHDDNVFEPKELSSKYINIVTKENDKSLPTIALFENEQIPRTEVNKIEDFGILGCLPEFSFDEEARKGSIDQYFQSLSEAEPLYYALYANPPEDESKLDLLFDYYNHLPNNPIVSIDLISSCVSSLDNRCTNDFVKGAIASDSKNGAAWVSAISFYAATGNTLGILDSIDALTKTSIFNERFGEKSLLYAQALEGSPSNHFNVNALAGIGMAATSFPAYSPITQWCEQGLDEPEKVNACLILGEQLETRSKTLISQAIGMALQDMVFKSQGNTEAVRLIEKKRKELTLSSDNDLYKKAFIMLILDERLLRSWMNNLDIYGEIESQRLLEDEAETLYKTNENYLCTLVYGLLDSVI